jgi:hypothetical protein
MAIPVARVVRHCAVGLSLVLARAVSARSGAPIDITRA